MPIYQDEYIQEIPQTHKVPLDFKDRVALYSIRLVRTVFDKISGYNEQ